MCTRCPHFVRHGKPSIDGKSIDFSNNCGLLIKQEIQSHTVTTKKVRYKSKAPENKINIDYKDEKYTCLKYPFEKDFEYISCSVYQDTFKSGYLRNGAFPSSQNEYVDSVSTLASVADMDLL
jgi:hypothetical protein